MFVAGAQMMPKTGSLSGDAMVAVAAPKNPAAGGGDGGMGGGVGGGGPGMGASCVSKQGAKEGNTAGLHGLVYTRTLAAAAEQQLPKGCGRSACCMGPAGPPHIPAPGQPCPTIVMLVDALSCGSEALPRQR